MLGEIGGPSTNSRSLECNQAVQPAQEVAVQLTRKLISEFGAFRRQPAGHLGQPFYGWFICITHSTEAALAVFPGLQPKGR